MQFETLKNKKKKKLQVHRRKEPNQGTLFINGKAVFHLKMGTPFFHKDVKCQQWQLTVRQKVTR